MSATDLPLRLRVGPDVLSVVVSAYAAMIEALGPLWTCQAFPVGPASVCDVPTVRPILHGLTVRWTDHARSGGGVYVGWDADVAGDTAWLR